LLSEKTPKHKFAARIFFSILSTALEFNKKYKKTRKFANFSQTDRNIAKSSKFQPETLFLGFQLSQE